MATRLLKSFSHSVTIALYGVAILFLPLECYAGNSFTITPRENYIQLTEAEVDPSDLYNIKNPILPSDEPTANKTPLSNIDKMATDYNYETFQDRMSSNQSVENETAPTLDSSLIDDGHDFNYNFENSLPLHPYMAGTTGGAMPDYTSPPSASALALQSDGMSPLFRVGAGAAYRLGSQWNLSLDYQAGMTGTNDQIFTGRSQQPIDLQVLNMGMHYQF